MRAQVLGVGFDRLTMPQAVEKAGQMLAAGSGGYICTPNPEIVWAAQSDKTLCRVLENADIVLPDGIGVVWASKKLGCPVPERVAGCDFLIELLSVHPCRVYLLGGKPGAAQAACRELEDRCPGVEIAGYADGYYTDEKAAAEAIRAAGPQLLVVCLGAPKQELFMYRHRSDFPDCLMIGLGGTVDVLAGTEKRAPAVWRSLNLEWLYRLLRHPGRLKRQAVLPKFVLAVLKQYRSAR